MMRYGFSWVGSGLLVLAAPAEKFVQPVAIVQDVEGLGQARLSPAFGNGVTHM
jgi:hypothetical protein